MKYIDVHGHINFATYNVDREETIKRAFRSEVGIINIGTDLSSSVACLELAQKRENMWTTAGFHPIHSHDSVEDSLETGEFSQKVIPTKEFDFAKFEKLASDRKVVAIGECGLDYFHTSPADVEAQREIFLKQIDLANKLNKPLMLHIRNGKTGTVYGPKGEFDSAYKEAVAILKEHAKVKADFHFFTGTIEDAKAILEIGGYFSFTGVLTFTTDYDGVVRYIPLERIMAETDCPYVAPVPYRGKRNEPVYVIEVVNAISRIRGDGPEATAKQLLENSKKFFGI
jgi:TatD DNase family protein